MKPEGMTPLYENAERSVFRLEALNVYDVEAEAEEIRAFEAGLPFPRVPEMEESTEGNRRLVARGVKLQRLHVVDLPLTPYLRYELTAYDENVESGEEVLVADRAWHPDLAELTQDFALFDAETTHPSVVWMHYDASGKPGEYDYTEDPTDVARCIRLRDLALAHSVPLEKFRALINME
jgi:hypothetical protein